MMILHFSQTRDFRFSGVREFIMCYVESKVSQDRSFIFLKSLLAYLMVASSAHIFGGE